MKLSLNPFFTLGFISLSLGLISSAPHLSAQQTGGRASNDDYILHEANFNFSSGKAANSQFGLGFTAGQLAPGLYEGDNYTVRAGFQYYYSIIPFSFRLSNQFVDFGPLVPGSPVTRTTNITLSNGSAFGYDVVAYENHALRNAASGSSIPDTTCDAGTCSETTPALWINTTTYGLGYRCDNVNGTECASDFLADYYKQFANIEDGEAPESVMGGANVGRDFETQITYKLNVSATQPSGLYENQIVYIATPSI